MPSLSSDQIQRVLDSYSVGRILSVGNPSEDYLSPRDSFKGSVFQKGSDLSRIPTKVNFYWQRIITSQGAFFLVYAINEDIHALWWGSDNVYLLEVIANKIGLTNVQPVPVKNTFSRSLIYSDHKFGMRFFLLSENLNQNE